MNCRKQIVMTGYHVQFVDLREPKPRTVYDETYVLDRKFINALGVAHINVIDYITEKYAKAGYHVCNVQKVQGKRVAYVDLRQMWEDSAPVLVDAADQTATQVPETDQASEWQEVQCG